MNDIFPYMLAGMGLVALVCWIVYLYLQYDVRRKHLDTSQKHAAYWYESTMEAVLLFEVEGPLQFRILAINGAAEHFYSRYLAPEDRIDFIGKNLREVFVDYIGLSEPEADYKIATYQKVVDTKSVLSFEEQSRVPNLGELITQTRIKPILNKRGEVKQLSYAAYDISAFRKAAQKSKEANQLLQEAQQIAQIGVWHWNAEISVFDWSPKMREIFGVAQDETPTFSEWVSMIHPEDENRIRQEIEASFADHSSFSLDHKIIRKDGETRYVNTWGGLRISKKGEVREVFGLCRDRTEEKLAEDRLLAAVIKAEDKARKQIARDLHDGLGQNLTTVLLNLNTLSREKEVLSEKGKNRLSVAKEYLDLAIQESRKIAHALMPQVVVDFGFVLALQNLINALEGGAIEYYFYHNLPENLKLPAKIEISFYRICQEAIQNIIKHAAATEVNIQLTQDEELLQLTIEDNGKGFDPAQSEDGLGISNIRTRVQALGGLLFIDSILDKGSTITIQIAMNTYPYGHLENTHR
ncbi:MAG: PAS domain-containing protein [Bacteroidota bacterium]